MLFPFSLLVPAAHANPLSIVNALGNSAKLMPAMGFDDIAGIVVGALSPLVLYGAYAVIGITGIRLIIGQEDDARDKAKTILNVTLAGVIVMKFLSKIIIAFFVGGVKNPSVGISALEEPVMLVISWGLSIAAVLAVTMIIISAVRAIATSGSEEGLSHLRKTVFAVIAGILLLVMRATLTSAFATDREPGPLIEQIALVAAFILRYVLLLAVGVLIFAGLQFITSGGQQERATKARQLIIRSLIGVVVVLLSSVAVQFVVSLVSGDA